VEKKTHAPLSRDRSCRTLRPHRLSEKRKRKSRLLPLLLERLDKLRLNLLRHQEAPGRLQHPKSLPGRMCH